ncbi:MAG: cytochrome c4 [Nitrosomonadales bacterium]|nr:MAG: cytochrome c4 [Nitrosomonadales bacterium]
MKRTGSIAAIIGGCFMLHAPAWAESPSQAAMLSNTCAGCHGTSGTSAGPSMPTIAGMPEVYLLESMKKFRSGERPSSIMGRLAKAYSDEEIKMMAEFFARHPFGREKQEVDAAKVAIGKQIHDQRCKKCHMDNGRDSEDSGILAGQWKEYLQISMRDFRSGKRPMPEKMRAKVEGEGKLTPEEVEAVIHFYASQQ